MLFVAIQFNNILSINKTIAKNVVPVFILVYYKHNFHSRFTPKG
jgi:hypothetical protein